MNLDVIVVSFNIKITNFYYPLDTSLMVLKDKILELGEMRISRKIETNFLVMPGHLKCVYLSENEKAIQRLRYLD